MIVNVDLYHVINRGVDGREIFLDTQDYTRFVHDLFEFNDSTPATPFLRATAPTRNVRRTTSYIRDRIVDIHGWVLMKNHFHLLISERVDGGLTQFLRKLSGYARYFNDRHHRRGTLFQGRSKKVVIARPEHFLYILHYVHLNPLDYFSSVSNWRERDKGSIIDPEQALTYLDTYRWSSFLDYCGERNFPSLLTKTIFDESHGEYRQSVRTYLCDRVEELPASLEEM